MNSRLILTSLAALALVISFQNCAPEEVPSGLKSKSSKLEQQDEFINSFDFEGEGQADKQIGNSGDHLSFTVPGYSEPTYRAAVEGCKDCVPEQKADICYEITCTSMANRTQTVRSRGGNDQMLTAVAPSGKGAWVFIIEAGKIKSSINCWSDRGADENASSQYYPMYPNHNLCLNHAQNAGSRAPYDRFYQGAGHPFKRCAIKSKSKCATNNNNAEFKVTCTSLAGSTQTMYGRGNSDVLTAKAPSGAGAWVVKVKNNRIEKSYNCFSNKANQEWLDAGRTPQYRAISECQQHAPTVGVPSPHNNFGKGVANPFKSCTLRQL